MDSSIARPFSGAQWTIAADGHEAVIVEVGGGLRTYRHDGVDLLDGYADGRDLPRLRRAGAGPLAEPDPRRSYTFDGRTHQLALTEPERHVAIHGLVNWVPLAAASTQSGDAVTVGYDLPPQPGYPWPLRLRTRWSVGADGLRAEHEVTNIGAEAGAVRLLRAPVPAAARASRWTTWCCGCRRGAGCWSTAGCCRSGRPRWPAPSTTATSPRRIGDAVLDTCLRRRDPGRRRRLVGDPRPRRTARRGAHLGGRASSAGGRSSPATRSPASGTAARWRSSR